MNITINEQQRIVRFGDDMIYGYVENGKVSMGSYEGHTVRISLDDLMLVLDNWNQLLVMLNDGKKDLTPASNWV